MESERFSEASERLRAAELVAPGSAEVDELETRLEAAKLDHRSNGGQNEAIEELQKRIRWGMGRRSRSREP
jgi:hypothetical protein